MSDSLPETTRPQIAGMILAMSVAMTVCSVRSSISQEEKPDKHPKAVQALQEQVTLPKYEAMELPDAEALLRARAYDWIVLKNQDVLVVDALGIRPDLIGRLTIKQDMATQAYNRIIKHKPYKDAELASLKQYLKEPDKLKEIDEREKQLKLELDAARDRPDTFKPATYKLQITLQDGSVDPEYALELRYVDTIVNYEDLVLRRADRLIEEGKTALAYDLLLLVARRHRENNALIVGELEADERKLLNQLKDLEDERTALRKSRDELNSPKNKTSGPAKTRLPVLERTIVAIAAEMKDVEEDLRSLRFKMRFVRPKDFPNPDPIRKDDLVFPSWPKFDEIYQRLVFADADKQFERGFTEESLRLVEELWKPGIDIPGLSMRMGRAVDKLIDACLQHDDFRQARHFLADLELRDPSNPVIQKRKDDLSQRAVSVLQEARDHASKGDMALAVRTADRAALIWPQASGLKDAHRELAERYQILKVGVTELSEQKRSGIPTEADERIRWLTEARLFEPASTSEQGVRYRSSFFDSWEPTDLGRRVQFRLRFKRAEWEARPLVTSADVFAEMLSRTDPTSANFDERLAGFVDGVSVQSPTDFTVNFRQLPLRPEALWQLTVPIGSETRALNDGISVPSISDLGRYRFQRIDSPEGQASYRRVRAEPSAIRQRHIEEVLEIKYDSWERALQGLLRGETSMLPVADLRDLKGLRDDGRFQIVPYTLPRSHFLLFNPDQPAMLDGQFRRALLHAIPRQRLLADIVLKDAPDKSGRLITCPFPTNGYGYNAQLAQPDYDPSLAAALALTAKKQLGGELPVLKMICPDDSLVRDVAKAMIANWKRVGIEVQLQDNSDGDWDICYRRAKCVEPLMDVWPMLTLQASANVDSLQPLSEPTRRMLLELERAVNWTSATKILHRLSADLLIEARYVPLWELDEFLVARKNIVGIPLKLMHAYDDVERWTVQSWYSQDAP